MLYRPIVILIFSTLAMILVASTLLVITSWRAMERQQALIDELASVAVVEAPAKDRVQSLRSAARTEWYLSLGVAIVLPVFAAVLLSLWRRRILAPLSSLNYLMGLLARREFESALTHKVDPAFQPLFDNYNDMVERLIAFERAHFEREQSLRSEVRNATRALLQQQSALARAERMAATGEMAAGVAHDLRNPLAGIRAAIDNLLEDVDDSDKRERLSLIAEEIDRMSARLNELLSAARQKPEKSSTIDLSETVDSLLSLVGYQLPDEIRLSARVPADLTAVLPEAGLRQALLNLMLNSARAIGNRPGAIEVHAQAADENLRIRVCDDGPGFSEDALKAEPRAFSTSSPGGTGLGLAMVSRFARDLGGRLYLENRSEGGACVTIELPHGKQNG